MTTDALGPAPGPGALAGRAEPRPLGAEALIEGPGRPDFSRPLRIHVGDILVVVDPGLIPTEWGNGLHALRRVPGETPAQAAARCEGVAAAIALRFGRWPVVVLEPEEIAVAPERRATVDRCLALAASRLGIRVPPVRFLDHRSPIAQHSYGCTLPELGTVWLADDLRGIALFLAAWHEPTHLALWARQGPHTEAAAWAETFRILGVPAFADLYRRYPALGPPVLLSETTFAVPLPVADGAAADVRQVTLAPELRALYAWIRSQGIETGYYAAVQVTGGTATFDVLDAQASYKSAGGASNYYIGTNVGGWEFVMMVLKITQGGTLNINLRITGGTGGTAWYDDIHLKGVPPAITSGGYKGDKAIDDAGAIYVPGTEVIHIGTQGSPDSHERQVTVTSLDFEPTSGVASLGTWDNYGRFTNGMADSTARTWQGRVFIPAGCTITAFASGLYRSNAGASASAVLYRIDNGPSRTALVTNTASGTTGWQAPGGSCSQLASMGDWFLVEVTLNNGGTADRSGFADQTVTYTRPDYASTY